MGKITPTRAKYQQRPPSAARSEVPALRPRGNDHLRPQYRLLPDADRASKQLRFTEVHDENGPLQIAWPNCRLVAALNKLGALANRAKLGA